MNVMEKALTATEEATEKCKEAVEALREIEDYAIRAYTVLECQMDVIDSIQGGVIDDKQHEKLSALTEVAVWMVQMIRDIYNESPAA